jgi:hypothetical protein
LAVTGEGATRAIVWAILALVFVESDQTKVLAEQVGDQFTLSAMVASVCIVMSLFHLYRRK